MECISAISTAPGTGGVAIIRISGEGCLALAEKMFFPHGKTEVKNFEPYKMYVGEIRAADFSDNGMCVFFKAPKSFTGEDVVEFHCHGGVAVTHGILERTFELGARPATNGEFTKRAFLNGKLSLSSCEGLIDMINSESVAGIKSGYYLFKEHLKKKITDMQEVLTDILAGIDANIDYPEEGLIEDNGEQIFQKLSGLRPSLQAMVNSYSEGKIIKDGVNVALAGKTNTGKSSLLNALTGEQKAIVTDIAGTTRDIVESKILIDGIAFNLYDTAGIRETADAVEQIGIERSHNFIDGADIVVYVTDGTETTEELCVFADYLKDKRVIKVVNKLDGGLPNIKADDGDVIGLSCKTGYNLELLKSRLYALGASGINADGEYVTQKRHYFALKDALNALDNAINTIGVSPLDLVSYDIKECWSKLGEITGTTASESIINEIFSRFCVGK